MKTSNFALYLMISISLFTAILLTIWPLPGTMNWLRPAWTVLVLLYWTINFPQRVGLWWAWLVGLGLDGLQGTLLGEHALACLLIVYIVNQLRRQIIVAASWLQALIILLVMLVYQLIIFVIQGFVGQMINTWYYWLASVSAALLWPGLVWLLHAIRRYFKIY